MRLWSIHPRYLDRQGLASAWREGLLAQAVLAGRTSGYTRHPQLVRFREVSDPLGAVGGYLSGLHTEATARGYRYDLTRVDQPDPDGRWAGAIEVGARQVAYEWAHLMGKLAGRSPEVAQRWQAEEPGRVQVHPLFRRVPGPIADWEVVH